MSTWNCSNSEERIKLWRDFREEIRTKPKDEQLNKTANFFSTVPIGPRSLDYYSPTSWPTPWEILHYGLFCQNSISLLIYHTLSVVLKEGQIQIILIDDKKDRFLVPVVDNKYVLNYILGEISIIQDYPNIRIVDDFEQEVINTVR